MPKKVPMDVRAEAAFREGEKWGSPLDYSADGANKLMALIGWIEQNARIYLDKDDGEWVGDDVPGMTDLDALGAFFGELFVRHAGATWVTVDYEGYPQPAVVYGAVTVLTHDCVRRRVSDGPHVDLARIFRDETKAMAKQKKA
jgi:hypothetical protein